MDQQARDDGRQGLRGEAQLDVGPETSPRALLGVFLGCRGGIFVFAARFGLQAAAFDVSLEQNPGENHVDYKESRCQQRGSLVVDML
mmetsp:Transcript_50783/g.54943  ORF Transcript_50783/g.54943 Transcript_50783/m.54943 type:complete len:87 (-) Transcript_50783:1248-1508(-)